MFMKQSNEDPTLFDLFDSTDRIEPPLRLPYRAPTSKVHEVTEKVVAQLSKVDDFQCLFMKCPLWLHPCF